MMNKDKCYGCGKEFCICGVISSGEKFVIALMILMVIGTILTFTKVCTLCGIL